MQSYCLQGIVKGTVGSLGLGSSELQRSKVMDGTWMIEVRKERVWVVLKGHLES